MANKFPLAISRLRALAVGEFYVLHKGIRPGGLDPACPLHSALVNWVFLEADKMVRDGQIEMKKEFREVKGATVSEGNQLPLIIPYYVVRRIK